jgi:hypothetical protein
MDYIHYNPVKHGYLTRVRDALIPAFIGRCETGFITLIWPKMRTFSFWKWNDRKAGCASLSSHKASKIYEEKGIESPLIAAIFERFLQEKFLKQEKNKIELWERNYGK